MDNGVWNNPKTSCKNWYGWKSQASGTMNTLFNGKGKGELGHIWQKITLHVTSRNESPTSTENKPNIDTATVKNPTTAILHVKPKIENEEPKTVVLDEIQSECSVNCGEGVQTIRTVSCKKSCFPDCCKTNIEEFPCQIKDCKDYFGAWTSWSKCSLPCLRNNRERSLRNRSRNCEDDDGCNGRMIGKSDKLKQ